VHVGITVTVTPTDGDGDQEEKKESSDAQAARLKAAKEWMEKDRKIFFKLVMYTTDKAGCKLSETVCRGN
jgi:hypothetical protein